jgi:hypothetical protein
MLIIKQVMQTVEVDLTALPFAEWPDDAKCILNGLMTCPRFQAKLANVEIARRKEEIVKHVEQWAEVINELPD